MAIVTGVVTNLARQSLPDFYRSQTAFRAITSFKVGQGGWVNPGSGKVPRVPDATLTDLDIIQNPARYAGSLPVGATGWYQKNLTAADFAVEYNAGTGVNSTLVVSCLLDFGEYNADPISNPTAYPQIWEIGLFDQSGMMIFYGTFSQETKDSSKQLENQIRLFF